MTKPMYFLLILLPFSYFCLAQQNLSNDFSRNFIPNQGQFSKQEGDTSALFAKFTDPQGRELWITREGLRILTHHEQKGIQEQRICFSEHPINRKDVFFENPLPHHFNYFYPHCPQGIYGVKAYRNIRVQNIVEGFDLLLSLSVKGCIEQKIVQTETRTPANRSFEIKIFENVSTQTRVDDKTFASIPNWKKLEMYVKDTIWGVHAFSLGTYTSTTDSSLIISSTKLSNTSEQRLRSTRQDLPYWGTYWSGRTLSSMPDDTLLALDSIAGIRSFSLSASTLDTEGNLYIVGKDKRSVFSFSNQDTNYIVQDTIIVDVDAFIAKFSPQGVLLWANYYGSSRSEEATVVKLNSKNELYVAGYIIPQDSCYEYIEEESRWLNDFPIQKKAGAFHEDYGNVFFLKFTDKGERLWATLFPYGVGAGGSEAELNRFRCSYGTHLASMDIDAQDNVSTSYQIFNYPKYPNIYTTCDMSYGGVILLNKDDAIAGEFSPTFFYIGRSKFDKKQNAYIYGSLNNARGPFPLKEKTGAYYYNYRSSKDVFDVPLLIRHDSGQYNRSYSWATQIGQITARDRAANCLFHARDFLVMENDHLIISGITTSGNFPMVQKEQAYTLAHSQTYTNNCRQDSLWIFLSEFDENGKMIWSTFYAYKGFHSMAHTLTSDMEGGFYLMGGFTDANIKANTIYAHRNKGFLTHFDTNRKLTEEKELPLLMDKTSYYSGEKCYYDRVGFTRNEMEVHDFRFLHPTPKIHVNVSPYGILSITGNALSLGASLLNKPTENSYFQTSPENTDSVIAGFILLYSLCDTTAYPPIVLGLPSDSLYCAPLAIPVSIKDTAYPKYSMIWNAGTENESASASYTITKPGVYFAEARHKYPSCPSIYSDTIYIDSLPPPVLNFPQDTLKRCIGEGAYAIHASNPQATYLWSDGSTDSVYLLHYTGRPFVSLSCTVTNACGAWVADTITVEFLPPYAYLGQDTVLCNQDSLWLDIEKLNADIPINLQYRWFLNGIQVQGRGPNQGQYLITPQENGSLVVEVYSIDTDCKIAKDTLEFAYYPYPDVSAHISDTTICAQTQTLFVVDLSNQAPDASAQWYSNSHTLLGKEDRILLSEEGSYILLLQNSCSQAVDTFQLFHYPLWWTELVIPSDTFMCQDIPILLDVRIKNHPTTYQWGDESTTSNGLRSFTKAGEYEITLTDSMGCTQSHTLDLRSEDCSPILEIPNVFTPNDDGINDVLRVKTEEQIHKFSIQIFNSWGLQVSQYKGDADKWEWKGENRMGKQVPDGAYFWIALFEDFKGQKKKERGCVMVLR